MFLGIDPICQMGGNFLLSQYLVWDLHRRNLYVFKDVHRAIGHRNWADSMVLGLMGRIAGNGTCIYML